MTKATETSGGFDLANLVPSNTEMMELEHPGTGEPVLGNDGKPVCLEVVSVDDERYLKAQRRIIDRRMQHMQAKAKKGRNNAAALTAEELDSEQTSLIAAAVVGWSDNLVWEGKPMPYTPDNAVKIIKSVRWIRDQIDGVINERERFFAAPSTN